MNHDVLPYDAPDDLAGEVIETVPFDFGMTRRGFTQVLGAGLLLSVVVPSLAQRSPERRGSSSRRTVASRIHIGKDGIVTVLTGKVEMGQGARAELTQAAAEELRVAPAQIRMIMADTSLVPDDGISAGSRTTPSTVPAVRQGAAAAREVLLTAASRRWNLQRDQVEARDGVIRERSGQRTVTYAELAQSEEVPKAFAESAPADVELTAVKEWKVLGTSFPRPDARAIVTGAHQFPSDITRPGMLHGKVLRAPAHGAKLISVDLAPARAMKGVVAVHDGSFVGVAAPTRFAAQQALQAIADTAKWEAGSGPSNKDVFTWLRDRAPANELSNPFTKEIEQAKHRLEASYQVAYVQHAPLEPRAAVAEWKDGNLTVWTGTQNPFGYHRELAQAFRLRNEQVRVIVPDFGSGFGGKHSGEAAIEAARLAQAAERPVSLRWTREEEFTWAYFRPAGVIQAAATLDAQNQITSWHFININSGGAAVDTPYRAGNKRCRAVGSNSPLRQGSYRALASTANNFARESFMDELAAAAGMDPLAFRLAHLEHPRLRAVLEAAAKRFDWNKRVKEKGDIGVGLACGTEKGSYVAACVEVRVDRQQMTYKVRRVCEVFECGAILNPRNLMAQVQSCIIMGLGAALREEMRFNQGKILNPTFSKYLVPRFEDVPELDIEFLPRPDLPAVGGGETPIIAIAPAIANALYHATGLRVRQMPIRLETARAVPA